MSIELHPWSCTHSTRVPTRKKFVVQEMLMSKIVMMWWMNMACGEGLYLQSTYEWFKEGLRGIKILCQIAAD